MGKPPVDLPRFKRLHRTLWDLMLEQKKAVIQTGQAMKGRISEHERLCLGRVQEECRQALKHANAALQRLFETADAPSQGIRIEMRGEHTSTDRDG